MLFNESEGVVEEVETEEAEETETTIEEAEGDKEEKVEKKTEAPEAKLARLKRQASQLEKKLGITDESPKKTKSDDLDYGQKAFLIANGIKDAKDIAFIRKELKGSGLELDELLDNGYFKEKFSNFQELNKTADAVPKGKRGGGIATDSVEYWASKPIAEVPQDMRIKVVNYRLEKEKSVGVFYNSK